MENSVHFVITRDFEDRFSPCFRKDSVDYLFINLSESGSRPAHEGSFGAI